MSEPLWFWTPAHRGRLCDIRLRVHEGGRGEIIARQLELEHAKRVVKAVNRDSLFEELVSSLKELTSAVLYSSEDTAPAHRAFELLSRVRALTEQESP